MLIRIVFLMKSSNFNQKSFAHILSMYKAEFAHNMEACATSRIASIPANFL